MSTALRLVGDVLVFLLLSIVAIFESLVRFLIPSKYKMKSVSGEIALVTGSGNGLGRVIAVKLAELGAIVVLWDINAQGLEETKNMIKAVGGTCYSYVCNLCDREDVYKKAALVTKDVGRVSILVNNAGVVTGERLLNSPDQLIIRTMEVNILSHFWTVKAFLPAMLKVNKGHIVTIASLAGHVGCPKLVDYAASKFAAVGFDEALRLELWHDGYDIKTTVICPYFIRSTGMFDNVMSRIIPTLTPNIVAERVITAIRCDEKHVVIPGYLTLLLALKALFPIKCGALLMRCLVNDVSPNGENPSSMEIGSTKLISDELIKDQNSGTVLHQQLTRRVSNSERKP